MPIKSPTAFFELELDNKAHVADPAHKDILKERRSAIINWLANTDSMPPVTSANRFQDFVVYSDSLKESVNELSATLKEYLSRPKLKRPLNILLHAPPGSGKSFLVKNICESLVTVKTSKLIEINCSNLLSPKDMINVFDRIQYLHENAIVPLIFFDEVDIPAWSVYQFLLMPMWDGAYLSAGLRHEFESAIFFYAESYKDSKRHEFFVAESEAKWLRKEHEKLRVWLAHEAPPKASDFYSRIDFYLYIPPLRSHFVDMKPTRDNLYWHDEETLQISVSIISRQFQSVNKVDSRVLSFLSGAFLETKRELERIIFLSTVGPTDDIFKFDHLPKGLIGYGEWFEVVEKLDPKDINLT